MLRDPVVRTGDWRLLDCVAAWDGNPTSDDCVAWRWAGNGAERLVVVNYAGHPSQCFVRGSFAAGAAAVRFTDLMGPSIFDRDRADLDTRGLYVDLPAWGYYVFDVRGASLTCG